MNRWTVLFLVALLCATVVLGCSGKSSITDPVTPDLSASVDPASNSQTHLWGYYDVIIDIETQTVEVVSDRTVMFTANVVQFLNGSPVNLSFNILDTPIGPDYIDVNIDVTIRHPFPGMPGYNGYDVRGVFIGDASGSLNYNGDCEYAVHGTDQFMAENDGYTRWFNPDEFTNPGLFGYTPGMFESAGFNGDATINPYRYFADGLGTNADVFQFLINTNEDGVFSSGSVNTRNYYLRFPNSKGVAYGYAVTANWVSEFPLDHPANAPEALACDCTQTPDVYYIDGTTNGGDIVLDFSLFGWHDNPSDIYIESNVLTTAYQLNTTEIIPVGGNDVFSTWHVEVPADNVGGLEGNEYWVIAEYDDLDYENEYGILNTAAPDLVAAFFRFDLFVLDVLPCTDPILDHMDPATGYIDGALDDAEIIGDEFEAGSDLACYLTDGVTTVPGTDVTWVDAQTVTADFDFGAAGADVGWYDLYFTDGDGCEVVLEDALEVMEVDWPIEVASGNNYHVSKFIEDSNGVYHIMSSYDVNPTSGPWQMHWFHSEDGGLTWTAEGNIWPVGSAYGTCSTTGHLLAADDNGGVYFVTGGSSYRSYLCYLDTDSLGEPSTWETTDWSSKAITYYSGRAPVYWALEVSPDGAIFCYARHYSWPVYNRYIYATSWANIPPTGSGMTFPSYIAGLGSIQEQLSSAARGIVWNPDTETFFLAIGGRWNNYYCGAYVLEYNPTGNTFTYRSSFEFLFSSVSGLGWYNDIYYGDLTIDSNDNIHWVYVTTWPNPPTMPYTRQKNEFVMNYGTNQSGSWVEEEPINDPSTTYRFPNVLNYPDPRNYYRPGYINLVVNSNDDLIMTWKKCNNDPEFMASVNDTSGGSFPDPSVLMDTTGDQVIYQGPQGEAVGTSGEVALTFTGLPYVGAPGRGALYFVITDGETPFD